MAGLANDTAVKPRRRQRQRKGRAATSRQPLRGVQAGAGRVA